METAHHINPLEMGSASAGSASHDTKSPLVHEVSNAGHVDIPPYWLNLFQTPVATKHFRKARKLPENEAFLAQSLTTLAKVNVTQTDGLQVSNAATAIAGIALRAIQHPRSFVAIKGSLPGYGGFGFYVSPAGIRVTAYEVTTEGAHRHLGGRGVVLHTGEGRLIESYPADFAAALSVIRGVVAGGGIHACTGAHLVPDSEHGGSVQACACISRGVR